MIKRLLSILLTFCMVLGLLPQMALAAEFINIQGEDYKVGAEVTSIGLDLSQAPDFKTYYK